MDRWLHHRFHLFVKTSRAIDSECVKLRRATNHIGRCHTGYGVPHYDGAFDSCGVHIGYQVNDNLVERNVFGGVP